MNVSAVKPIGMALFSSLSQSSQLKGRKEAGLEAADGPSTAGNKAAWPATKRRCWERL